jgi:flagellar biogenesis protein FliO
MELTEQVVMILAVFALLGGVLWLLKRRGVTSLALPGRRSSARRLEVLERIPLTPHHALHLVRISDKVVLIGTAPSACALLDSSVSEISLPQTLVANQR